MSITWSQLRGHAQTIIPALTRSAQASYREYWEISTPDGDLLELARTGAVTGKAVLLSHGLEGSAYTPYMIGMSTYLASKGYEVYVWNYRGCGKKLNPGPWYYHSGKTDDLKFVIEHLLSTRPIEMLYLAGFSIGGNLTLKYLGEEGKAVPSAVKAAICISAPLELKDCALHLDNGTNRIYLNRFLRSLKRKLRQKEAQYPGSIDLSKLDRITNFIDFDEYYTAPHSGFLNADDYYLKCSSLYYLQDISIPTLLLNAQNDPFLAHSSFPVEFAIKHPYLQLEMPSDGGHVGFRSSLFSGEYYSEKRTFEFISANQ